GRTDQEVRDAGLYRLPRGRQEAEDAETASADGLWHVAGGVPRAVGPATRLSDGGAELCQAAQQTGEGNRSRDAAAPPTQRVNGRTAGRTAQADRRAFPFGLYLTKRKCCRQ